jgi:ABC transporter, ATP-binding protein
MDEAEYCDRIMIQDQGKMLILGTPEEVRDRSGKNLTMNEAFIAIVENSRRKEEL